MLCKEIYGNKYLTLVPTNKSKEKNKKYEEIWGKIRNLIRSITKNSYDYDEKYIKIKFNSDDKLPLNKTIKTPSMAIVVRAIFYESNKYCPQVFLYKYLYKLQTRKKQKNNLLNKNTYYHFRSQIKNEKRFCINIIF